MERNHTGAGLARNLPQRMGGWFRANPVAGAILILCLVIEGVLEGADAGLWGQADWRMLAVDYGAFFGVLLHGAQPNYPLQPVAMFVTYGFLHAGFVHVAVNMFTLVVLAAPVSARLGQARFASLYFIALIAGGAGFGLLSTLNAPMLGASGALFGLAGAILAWAWRDRRAFGQPTREIVRVLMRPILYLVLFNVVMFAATGGEIAWQTHLGGFLAGWAAALWLDPRRPLRFSV